MGSADHMQFDDAGLHPVMRENIKLCQYGFPTPIQSYCIPAVLSGRDVIGIAQTGESLQPMLSHVHCH